MRRSTDRILVSHAGNLPRPDYINELIDGGLSREGSLNPEYAARLPKAVQHIVDRQIELGDVGIRMPGPEMVGDRLRQLAADRLGAGHGSVDAKDLHMDFPGYG